MFICCFCFLCDMVTPFSLLEELLVRETGEKMALFYGSGLLMSERPVVYCYPQSASTLKNSSYLALVLEDDFKKPLFTHNEMPEGFTFTGNISEKSGFDVFDLKQGSYKPTAEVSYVNVVHTFREGPWGRKKFATYEVATDRLRGFLQEAEQRIPFRYTLSLPSLAFHLGDNSADSELRKVSITTALGNLNLECVGVDVWMKKRSEVEQVLPYFREHGEFMEAFAQNVKRSYQQARGLYLDLQVQA